MFDSFYQQCDFKLDKYKNNNIGKFKNKNGGNNINRS